MWNRCPESKKVVVIEEEANSQALRKQESEEVKFIFVCDHKSTLNSGSGSELGGTLLVSE